MALSDAAWRAALLPASFRGAEFHVELGARASGRRIALHEYPKKDTPYSEDMGRRAQRFSINAYIVDQDYLPLRDFLISACEIEGPGTLILPTTDPQQVVCDSYSCSESRERGGYVAFEIAFIEAGQPASNAVTDDTQGQVAAQAGLSAQQPAAETPSSTFPGSAFGGGAPQGASTFPGAAFGGGAGPAAANSLNGSLSQGFASPAQRA